MPKIYFTHKYYDYDAEKDVEFDVEATGNVENEYYGKGITDDEISIDGVNINDVEMNSDEREVIEQKAIDMLCEWTPETEDSPFYREYYS